MQHYFPRLSHDITCSIVLGFATLCLFMGYFAHSFVSESILHSVNERSPSTIDPYAGYYGQAVQFGFFSFSCLISPSVVRFLSSKGSLMLCAALFSLFFAGYLHLNAYYYYVSQALVGFGYAVYNNAEGAYLSEHCTDSSIEWSMALETGIGHGGQFVSGIVLYLVTNFPISVNTVDSSSGEYSELHIKVLYAIFLAVGVLSFILFSAMPGKPVEGSLANNNPTKEKDVYQQLKSTIACAFDRRMILFIPCSLYQGAFSAFFLAVFPTSFSFNTNVAQDADLVAFYCTFIGVGVVCGGLLISMSSKKIPNFALVPSMCLHLFFMAMLIALIWMTTSDWSFVRLTADFPPVFQTCRLSVCAIGFLVGLSDCCITTARGVICQILIPEKRMETFSVTKLFQAFAGCIVFSLSPYLAVSYWVCFFYLAAVLGVISFLVVSYFPEREKEETLL